MRNAEFGPILHTRTPSIGGTHVKHLHELDQLGRYRSTYRGTASPPKLERVRVAVGQSQVFSRDENMARYKGQNSAIINERNFPHIVEIVVPPGGLSKTLDAMYEFHARYGIHAKRGQGQYTKGQNFIRWCFADREVAAAFAREFQQS
jgi:hypothetical protein